MKLDRLDMALIAASMLLIGIATITAVYKFMPEVWAWAFRG